MIGGSTFTYFDDEQGNKEVRTNASAATDWTPLMMSDNAMLGVQLVSSVFMGIILL